jgi:hypothetical protein
VARSLSSKMSALALVAERPAPDPVAPDSGSSIAAPPSGVRGLHDLLGLSQVADVDPELDGPAEPHAARLAETDTTQSVKQRRQR